MKSKIHQDVYVGVSIILLSIFVFIKSNNYIITVRLFPLLLSVILIILAIFMILEAIKKGNESEEQKEQEITKDSEEESISIDLIKSPLTVTFIILIYISLISVIGFFTSTILFLLLLLRYLKTPKIATYFILIIGLNVFVYLLFVTQLGVRLPTGFLF